MPIVRRAHHQHRYVMFAPWWARRTIVLQVLKRSAFAFAHPTREDTTKQRAPSPLLACARGLVDMVRDLGEVMLKVVAQPIREGLRALVDAALDLIERERLHCGNLGRIGTRLVAKAPEKHIDVFVLLHAVIEIGAIAAEKSERQRRADAERFMQPPAGGRDRALARARMAAAGVRPQSARVIFLLAALLQHDLSLGVGEEDREGAVQETLAVDQVLAVGADGMVAFVDQDQLFVSHVGEISPLLMLSGRRD